MLAGEEDQRHQGATHQQQERRQELNNKEHNKHYTLYRYCIYIALMISIYCNYCTRDTVDSTYLYCTTVRVQYRTYYNCSV